jgi:hypothetical protein
MTDLMISKDRPTYMKILPTVYRNGSLQKQEAKTEHPKGCSQFRKVYAKIAISLVAAAQPRQDQPVHDSR